MELCGDADHAGHRVIHIRDVKTSVWLKGSDFGSGFEVWGSEFRVQGSGCRVHSSGLGVQGSGFWVQGFGSWDLAWSCVAMLTMQGMAYSSYVM